MRLFLFWASALFIIYTYFIYPALVFITSRIIPGSRVGMKDFSKLPSMTLVVVVRNEEDRIEEKIENSLSLDYPEELLEVCFVSDGSTDRTDEILSGRSDVKFISRDTQKGKPARINEAVRQTNSEIIVFSDVRQKFAKDALRELASNFADPQIGAVSGELRLGDTTDSTGRNIGLYWRYEKFIRKAEGAVDSTLGATGAIYAIRRELFEPIPEDTILDDIEIPLRIFRRGYRVIFDSEAVALDDSSSRIEKEWNRKVRTLAGNFQLFSRNTWLFDPTRNRIFVQTVSHKFFRLLIPYALIVLFLASAGLDFWLYRFLFVIQIVFYACGLATLLLKPLTKSRALSFISVFISLNAAAVAGLYRFAFKKTDARWK